MSSAAGSRPGWHHIGTDPAGTERYWNGSSWTKECYRTGAYGSLPRVVQHGVAQQSENNESSLAGVSDRIAARFLDGFVWFILWFGFSLPNLLLAVEQREAARLAEGRLPLWVSLIDLSGVVLAAVAIVGYEAWFTNRFTSTIGKRIVKLRIVKLDGSIPTWADSARRLSPLLVMELVGGLLLAFMPQQEIAVIVMSLVIPALYVMIGIAAAIVVGSNATGQAPWDKISKTTVVYDR